MFKDKKAMSGIITTIMIVALVLVLFIIVWGVISNIVNSQACNAELSEMCTDTSLLITGISCTSTTNCDVVVKRTRGSSDLESVTISVSDGKNSLTKTFAGGLDNLQTKEFAVTGTTALSSTIGNKGDVAASVKGTTDMCKNEVIVCPAFSYSG